MALMKLSVVALDRMLYEGDVKQITAETTAGQITILPGHIATAAVLVDAPLVVWDDNNEKHYISVHRGYLSINKSELLVVADHAIFAEEIDEQRVLEDIRKHEEMLKTNKDDLDIARLKVRLQRDLTDLKVHQLLNK